MTKTNNWENSILDLLFNATGVTNIADNTATSPLTNLYVSLHTGDPGEAGTQTTNECTYGSYARIAVARTSGGWTITANSVSPAANIDFAEATSGTETATHFGVGSLTSGAGVLYYSGAISPTIAISTGVIPRLTTATAITED